MAPGSSKTKTERINESIANGGFVANGKNISLQNTLVVFFDDSEHVLTAIKDDRNITEKMPHQLMVSVYPNEIGNKNRYYYHNDNPNHRQNIDSIFDKIDRLKLNKGLSNVLIITDLDATVANTTLVSSAVVDMGSLARYEELFGTLPTTPEDYPNGLKRHCEGTKNYPVWGC